MNFTIYLILSIVGILYLVQWPIRLKIWEKQGLNPKKIFLFIPLFAALMLIAVDIMAILQEKRPAGVPYLFTFLHIVLSAFGASKALNFGVSRKEK